MQDSPPGKKTHNVTEGGSHSTATPATATSAATATPSQDSRLPATRLPEAALTVCLVMGAMLVMEPVALAVVLAMGMVPLGIMGIMGIIWPGLRFSGAVLARAANWAMLWFAGLDDQESVRVLWKLSEEGQWNIGTRMLRKTNGFMTPTMPAWQCIPWEQ